MNENKTMNAVIYSRVASPAPTANREATLPGQETRCREYAATHGYTVVATFSDVGSGNNGVRPCMSKMLAFLETHRTEKLRVLMADPQRLARNTETFIELHTKIREAGGVLEPVESARREIAEAPRVRIETERERER